MQRTTSSGKDRPSESEVSHRGANQESDHNKHNKPTPQDHKPQKHSPAEEKHSAWQENGA